jgi:hypothetical protein
VLFETGQVSIWGGEQETILADEASLSAEFQPEP